MKTYLTLLGILSLILNYLKAENYPGKPLDNYVKTPLSFAANKGQTNNNVSFISRGNNCTMFFNEEGTSFSLINSQMKFDGAFEDFALTDALVAYYPFNGNANDAGPNGYNGVVKRARLCEDRNGNANSAYCFNGSDNYIQIDSIKEFNQIDAISVCAWICPLSYENYVAWISKPLNEDKSQFRLSFGSEPYNVWGVVFYNETWNGNDARNSLIPLSQWSFVVATINQITGEVKLYLNGKEVGSFINNKKILKSDYPWYIGYQADDKNYFDGKVDEVRLYQRILSAEEILSLYNLK